MFFRRFHSPELSIYSYMLGDENTRQCVVIDPIRKIDAYIEAANQENLNIIAILETHVHADFLSGSKELKLRLQGKPKIYASKMGGGEWTPRYADCPTGDGDEIRLGSLCLKALHTPGHTPEHLVWLCFDDERSKEIPWFAFTGDLLFVGGVGRPDLLGDEAFKTLSKQLYHSLFTKLAQLPDFLQIYPAHGSGSLCGKSMSGRSTSTLGYEWAFNPSLKKMPEDRWIAELTRDMPAAPQSFPRIKKTNVQGALILSELPEKLPLLSAHALMEWMENGAFLIDVRSPLEFAAGHLEGAVNIPFGSSFGNWAGMVIPGGVPLALVIEDKVSVEALADLLRLIGLDEIVGYVFAKDAPIQSSDHNSVLQLYQAGEFSVLMKKGDAPEVIDVRTPSEWSHGHIQGARHIELARLPMSLSLLPKDKALAIICGSGFRSSVAASFLAREGYTNVSSIWGGMQGWRQASLPVAID